MTVGASLVPVTTHCKVAGMVVLPSETKYEIVTVRVSSTPKL